MRMATVLLVGFVSNAAFGMCYYSQRNQDQYLNETIFKNKRNGVFVDMGAYDGVTYSNTYFFEKELGWTGICCEPLAQPFCQLQHNRACICLNVCVAPDKAEYVDFIAVSGTPEMLSGMLATYDMRHFMRLLNEIAYYGGTYKITRLPAISFNEMIQWYKLYHIDYLSIDTEGSELAILRSIDFEHINIHVVSVENNYQDPSIKEFMTSKNFNLLCVLEQDEIYQNAAFVHDLRLDIQSC